MAKKAKKKGKKKMSEKMSGPVLWPVTEKVVPQYGPEWLEHVLSGGELRSGNVLVGDFGVEEVA